MLAPLSERCRRAGLPDLAALVVRKGTGMPGAGRHGPYPSADPDPDWAEAIATGPAFSWPAKLDLLLLTVSRKA